MLVLRAYLVHVRRGQCVRVSVLLQARFFQWVVRPHRELWLPSMSLLCVLRPPSMLLWVLFLVPANVFCEGLQRSLLVYFFPPTLNRWRARVQCG